MKQHCGMFLDSNTCFCNGSISQFVIQNHKVFKMGVRIANGLKHNDSNFPSFRHLWRNRLARSAVNRKVAGSSPAKCVFFCCFVLLFFFLPSSSPSSLNLFLFPFVHLLPEKVRLPWLSYPLPFCSSCSLQL